MIVTYEDAKKAAATIRKAVDPCSVILFGSVAREGLGNDLDLLILIDDGERNIEDAGSLVQNSLKPLKNSKWLLISFLAAAFVLVVILK